VSRFLFAWELGGGLGHSLPLALLARPLLEAGHEVDVALRDLSTAPAAFGDLMTHPRARFWQAPIFLATLRGLPESVSYAELLFRAGFLESRRLVGLARGWRSLFDAVRPDLLLVDHAPNALLAARGLPMRTAAIGTGFFLPPAQTPIPPFREWDRVDPQRVAQSEARALAVANEVLLELGATPLVHLHALTAVDEHFLLTWPEVDHYLDRTPRPNERYWGPLAMPSQGAAPVWPAGDGPKLFVYLKGDYGPVEAILRDLVAQPLRIAAYVPSLDPRAAQKLAEAPNLHLSARPLDMTQVVREAELALCNAGSGTVCTLLAAGIPSVQLPMHAEQMLFARRIEQLGTGLLIVEADARTQTVKRVMRVAREPAFRERARAFAQVAAERALPDVAAAVTARCVELAQAA
jgi:UDP:flavonoid glycosyltransferase YjiC (YdhE family)